MKPTTLLIGLITLISLHMADAVEIPDDIEILEGYHFDSQHILNPVSSFFGPDSSVGPRFFKAIRNKRNAAKYEVLESPGLRSHFHVDNIQDEEQKDTKTEKRFKRDAEEKEREEIEQSKTEEIPIPEKFVGEPTNYFRDSHKSMEQWTKTPYMNEFSKVQKEEDDSQYLPQADASTINEGIKARAPRVNFITQQNKNGHPEARDQRPSAANGNDLRDLYKIPNTERWNPAPPLPLPMSTRGYDQYPQMYNRDLMMTPPPPSFRYPYPEYYDERKTFDYYGPDRYMPREMSPRDLPRYDYPESRADASYRDYRPLYSNDINERLPSMGQRNRRIIYYATLPEIVRSPPNIEPSYNTYGAYYPYRDSYPISEAYRSSRLPRERDYMQSNNQMSRPKRPLEQPAPDMRSFEMQKDMNKYSSAPVKISSSLRVDSQRPDRRMFTEVTDTRERGRPSFQDSIEDRDRSYLSRHN